MNINARIRRFHQNQGKQAATVPPWAELVKLDSAEVEALADRLGIPFEDRLSTLSAIHHSRGVK